MTPRSWIALLALVALVPVGVRADEREWTEDYTDDPYGRSDYDVSVDVGGAVTLDTFERPLSSYGEWVEAGHYGRVWRPRVAAGWRPYYYGRWEWTNEGWLWVSDEPWGWAAYHYGRWAHDPYYGWIWVPGYEWAPAWVAWRTSGDVIGWAPLAPGLSVYVTAYPFVDFWWTFVPTVRFVSVPVFTVAFAPTHTRRWFHATAPSPARPAPRPAAGRAVPAPAPAWGGPTPRLIAERTGRAPTPARIVAAPSPGVRARPGEIPVFRPEARSAPARGVTGRGPDGWAPPGRARDGGAPPAVRGEARGPGAYPAPGRVRDGGAPPATRGEGRGPGAYPAPGRVRDGGAPPPSRGEGRGAGTAPAPGASSRGGGGDRDGERSAPPAWRSEPRGGGSSAPAPARGGRGDRGDRGSHRGGGRP
jgi:hypothetical protein